MPFPIKSRGFITLRRVSWQPRVTDNKPEYFPQSCKRQLAANDSTGQPRTAKVPRLFICASVRTRMEMWVWGRARKGKQKSSPGFYISFHIAWQLLALCVSLPLSVCASYDLCDYQSSARFRECSSLWLWIFIFSIVLIIIPALQSSVAFKPTPFFTCCSTSCQYHAPSSVYRKISCL